MIDFISLYIHIPFCKQKCDYCDFYSVAECNRRGKINDLSDDYILSVVNEVEAYVKHYDIRSFKTIYIGGGTPSLLTQNQLEFLLKKILSFVPIKNPQIEITLEANPENITESFLENAFRFGVNRISLGLQSFDDKVLKKINRSASGKQTVNAFNLLLKKWKGKKSIDLIAGLPLQTYKSFREGLQKVIDSKVEHISLYSLSVEENTPLDLKIKNNEIKLDFDKIDKMWLIGKNLLEKNGYVHYEVSNFCKNGFESVHNTTYWKLENYIGCGAGATSSMYDENIRWTNTMSIVDYQKFFLSDKNKDIDLFPRKIETLDKQTQKFEYIMMGMRMQRGVCKEEYIERFGEDFSDKFYECFEKWNKNHLAKRYFDDKKSFFALTKKGRLFLNAFLEQLI